MIVAELIEKLKEMPHQRAPILLRDPYSYSQFFRIERVWYHATDLVPVFLELDHTNRPSMGEIFEHMIHIMKDYQEK